MNRTELERVARSIRIAYTVSSAQVLEEQDITGKVVGHVVGNVEIDILDATYSNIAKAIGDAYAKGFEFGQERFQQRARHELDSYAHELTDGELDDMKESGARGDRLGDELELVIDAMLLETIDAELGQPCLPLGDVDPAVIVDETNRE